MTQSDAEFRPAARMGAIALSEIVQITETAARLRAEGRDVVALSTGEPDFPTPLHVIEAAHQAALAGQTRYPPTAGTPVLRAAIARGAGVEAAQVLVSTGAKQVLANALFATLDAGDEVVTPTPFWTSYADMVAIAGGVPVRVACPMEAGFKLTPAQLQAAITPRTRWLMLNSPSNPSGAVYSAGELAALAEVLRAHPDVWVIADEIYEHLSYVPFTSFRTAAPDLADRTLIVNGVSKAYSMTGWRLGWGIGPVALIKAMTAVQGQSTSGASSISQAAALAALEGDQSLLAERCAAMRARRDRVVAGLNATGLIHCPVPDGAFYVFPSCKGVFGKRTPGGTLIEDDAGFCQYLLEAEGVALVPGRAFGMAGHFRLSFAYADKDLEAGLARIARALTALT